MTTSKSSFRLTSSAGSQARVLGIMIPLLGLAFALRVPLLNGPRFHPDEALFASFARAIAVWRDPLLAAAPVDKPPLLFYLQAICYPFLGPKEMAARLPNLFASLVTVALTYKVTARLAFSAEDSSHHGGWRAGVLAALLAALSPLAVAFGATAFTDPLMVTWAMASLLAASSARPGWAGFWLGLGLATKYQAALFLPLVGGLVCLQTRSSGARRVSTAWARFGGGAAGPAGAVVIWELVRTGRFSLVGSQVASYGAARLLLPEEWGPRLIEWVGLARYLIPPPWLAVLLALALAWTLGRRPPPLLLTAGWVVGYFLVHWLMNIHPWDRYLLPVVPVVGLMVGQAVAGLADRLLPALARGLLPVVVGVLLLPAAIGAAGGALPIGGDHGTFDGIEQIGAFFADYPYGTVLYDHWLSWELRYYLFDSRVYVSWFPDARTLIRDLQAFGADPPRFLVIPAWESPGPLLQPARSAGFDLEPVMHARRADGSTSFILYQITER
jgi:4-amino-4-deoxy-L-arabinose transferase-like glycosyltransferase